MGQVFVCVCVRECAWMSLITYWHIPLAIIIIVIVYVTLPSQAISTNTINTRSIKQYRRFRFVRGYFLIKFVGCCCPCCVKLSLFRLPSIVNCACVFMHGVDHHAVHVIRPSIIFILCINQFHSSIEIFDSTSFTAIVFYTALVHRHYRSTPKIFETFSALLNVLRATVDEMSIDTSFNAVPAMTTFHVKRM